MKRVICTYTINISLPTYDKNFIYFCDFKIILNRYLISSQKPNILNKLWTIMAITKLTNYYLF